MRTARGKSELKRMTTRMGGAGYLPLATALALIALAAPAVAWPPFDHAVTTADGNGADAMVMFAPSDNESYGGQGRIVVQRDLQHKAVNSWGYLRFDTRSFTGEVLDARVTLAEERSVVGGFTSRVFLYGLKNGTSAGAGEAFDEAALCLKNAPGRQGKNRFDGTWSFDEEMTLLGTVDIAHPKDSSDFEAGRRIAFASPELIDFLNTDTSGLVVFGLTTRTVYSRGARWFATKEHERVVAGEWIAPTLEARTTFYPDFVADPALPEAHEEVKLSLSDTVPGVTSAELIITGPNKETVLRERVSLSGRGLRNWTPEERGVYGIRLVADDGRELIRDEVSVGWRWGRAPSK